MILNKKYNYNKLEQISTPLGRHYIVGENRALPSVTTVLDKTSDKSFLIKWRNRVGKEEAARITKLSVTIGNKLHKNLENHILYGSPCEGNLLTKLMTQLVIEQGLVNLNEVWGVEVPLYSTELYAGTTDLVGKWKSRPAIIDFKNSKRVKRRDWIEDYFIQTAAYAMAHDDMFNTCIETGVVMMACHTGEYVEFVIEGKEFKSYKIKWANRLDEYYTKYVV